MRKLVICLLLCFVAHAQTYPLSPEKLNRVFETFYENGELSQDKMEKFKDELKEMRSQVRTNVENYVMARDLVTQDEAEEISKENKFAENTKRLYSEWLALVHEINDPIEKVTFLATILDLQDSLKSEITPMKSEAFLLGRLKDLLTPLKVYKNIPAGQAYNLVNPKTGEFYTQAQLKELLDSGFDISLLNPPKDNGVIEDIEDISKINVYERYREGQNEMHQDIMGEFPKENVGFYLGLRKTQSRPKLMFETRDENGKRLYEYKMKMGKELHSEATAASLGVALGLYHDLSKHVRDIKLYMGDITYDEFARDFSSYFKYEDLARIVKSKGYDPVHGHFVIFHEGLLEMRFSGKQLRRVGPFYPKFQMGKREVRALLFYNLWVHNTDLKPGENNKSLVKFVDGKMKVYHSLQDVGFSIGSDTEKEKPTDFAWDVVNKKTKDRIDFKFHSLWPIDDWKVTYYDGKWMVRKIAQLTREQITQAVKFGAWPNLAPYNFEQLVVEKLINRRNQLVEAFDLVGEVLPNGKTIEIMQVNREIENEAKNPSGPIPGYTVDFRGGIYYTLINPLGEAIKNAFIDGAAAASRAIDKLDIDQWIGVDSAVVAQILLGTDKQVIENPEPRHMGERYLVKESFRIGSRLGYGLIFSADTAYVKEYTLIYPIEDKSMVDNKSDWVFDPRLPYRVMKDYLPKNHILMVDSFIENRGRVKIETPFAGLVNFGTDNALSRINLSRIVVNKKDDDNIKLFVDHSKFNQFEDRVYTKLGLIKLRHYSNLNSSGNLKRDIYKLNGSDNSMRTIDMLVINNDPDQLNLFKKISEINSDFITGESRFSLFGFFSKEKSYRVDDLKIYRFNDSGSLNLVDHQLSGVYTKERSWKFITNGENRRFNVTMSSETDDAGKLIEPYINLHFVHEDMNAKASEMNLGYIPFMNGVADDKNFIDFDAEKLSVTGLYGHLNFHLTQKIYQTGIMTLLHMRKAQLYAELNKLLNITDIGVRKYVQERVSGSHTTRKTLVKEYVDYKGFRYRKDIIQNIANNVLNILERARKIKDPKEQVQKLMRALVVAMPMKGHSQNPVVMAAINKIIGKSNYYLEAFIESPSYEENKMPGRITPFNSKGTRRDLPDRERISLQMRDVLELYLNI